MALTKLCSENKVHVFTLLYGIDKGQNGMIRDKTHITTSETPIFKHIQWIWNTIFWLGIENVKNDRQYDKI